MRSTLILLLLLCIIASAPSHSRQSCDWPFRTAVTITEQSGSTLSDYQVQLSIDNSHLHSGYTWTANGSDFRVFDSDDSTPLEFWIESWDQTNEQTTIWVRFPSSAPLQANQARTIYLYYGNESAPPLANVPFTFVEPGIKFHTRNTSFNPSNKTEAFNEFNSLTDNGNNSDGYGCTFITDFTGITKSSTFGSGDNFAAYSESYFEVRSGEEGVWEFRYGADFGRGGALYVNDTALEEDWNNDLWWNLNWNNADVLQGSIFLTSGYHKLEVIGFEGCCDGGITVQFRRPGGNWTTFNTSDIDVRSRACPVTLPTISYGSHDTCNLVDLRIRNNGLNIPTNWEINVTNTVTFAARQTGNGEVNSANPVPVTLTLPTGFQLDSFSGTDWSCTQVSTQVNCLYSQSLTPNSNSPAISLQITPDNTAVLGAGTISIEVSATFYDINRSNNLVTGNITLVDNDAIPAVIPSCSSPKAGIWARFFNIQTYPDVNLDTEAEMQAIVDDRVNETYLDGQSILANIDGSENPFDNRGDELFLTVLEGYINIPSTDDYTFGIDGDDSVEFRLNGDVFSHFYGLHGANGSPVDNQTARLEAGYHKVEYRMQENTGQSLYRLYWNPPFSGTSIVPSNYFFHCAGDANIQLVSSLIVLEDPINGTEKAKAIPGSIVEQTVVGTNLGNISTDNNSSIITQKINENNQLYVLDFNSSGPVDFTDQSSPNQSGLSYSYVSLSSTTDSLSFSNDNGSTFTYVPTPDADGYDDSVTHFRISFSGSFKPTLNSSQPGFTFKYKVRVN